MLWFIISIILLLIGVGLIAVGIATGGDGATLGFVPIVVASLLMIPACLYSQDAGEVVVLKNMGGSIAGYSADAGFHGKLPWQSTVKYDTRNNVISYVAKGKEDYDGGSARGPQVTVNDKNGAQADIDIQVNYSLDPKYAMDLYKDSGRRDRQAEGVERAGGREDQGRDQTHQGAGRGRRQQGFERFTDRQRAQTALHRRPAECRPADRHPRGIQHPHPTQVRREP